MRGLLVIEPLYQQIIAGNKTQTRRSGGLEAVNGRKATKTTPAIIANPDDWNLANAGYRMMPHNEISSVLFIRKKFLTGHMTDADSAMLKPRYKIGEVLYLKEPVSTRKYLIGCKKENGLISETWGILYKYSGKENHGITKEGMIMTQIIDKWSNKLFMPASAARAFIKITGIRCERLMDISDHDCIAEGIEEYDKSDIPIYKDYLKSGGWHVNPKWSFLSLYKFANKVKEVPNIWCWVYEIEYLKDYKNA